MSEPDTNERLSAFIDGELRGSARDRVVDALHDSPELRRRWARFHVIGDAMRGTGPVPGADTIAERVNAALGDETIVHLEPRPRRRLLRPLSGLAIAATIAGVAILGVQRLDDGGMQSRQLAGEQRPEPSVVHSAPAAEDSTVSRLASTAATPAGSGTARVQWSDAEPRAQQRLNVYLANHNEYAGGGMRGVLPYVRLVGYQSFAGDGR